MSFHDGISQAVFCIAGVICMDDGLKVSSSLPLPSLQMLCSVFLCPTKQLLPLMPYIKLHASAHLNNCIGGKNLNCMSTVRTICWSRKIHTYTLTFSVTRVKACLLSSSLGQFD